MNQESQNTDLSFLEKKNPNALSAKDILVTILQNLHWIVLCAVIGGVISWYRADRTDRIYESHAKIKIHSVAPNAIGGSAASLLESMASRRTTGQWNTLNDEMIILKSETSMLEVARRLNLGMNYRYKTKLVKRVKDLYKDSPILVEMPDMTESEYASFLVTVGRDSVFTVDIAGKDPVRGHLGDTVSTSYGRICVQPTWALRDLYFDNPIMVSHANIYDVANAYRGRVNVSRGNAAE